MAWLQRFGIHFRLLLAAVLLIGAAVSSVGFLGGSMVHSFVQSRFEDRMDFLCRYLALNSELGLLINDQSMLKTMARNLLSERDVVSVRIMDAQGREQAGVGKEMRGPYAKTSSPVHMKALEQDSLPRPQAQDQSGQVLGSVEITYSLREINQLLGFLQLRFAALSAAVVCIAVLIFYLISRSLVRPITRLASTTRNIAAGNKDERAMPDTVPETRDLAVSFNKMLDSLEESSQALEEAYQEMLQQRTLAEFGRFAMIIAHEIKNPLGIMKSSLDILKNDLDQTQTNTMVHYIEDEIRRLNRLIEDFLAFSKPVKPQFQPVEVNSLLQDIVLRFELQLANEPVVLDAEGISGTALTLNADADLLSRAVTNLMRNGFEANGWDGLLRIRSWSDALNWIVEIEDQGQGVSPEIQEKIFEPFFTTRAKGTGLGLAYTSQVVTAHGGRIEVRNSRQGGAIFSIVLPVSLT